MSKVNHLAIVTRGTSRMERLRAVEAAILAVSVEGRMSVGVRG